MDDEELFEELLANPILQVRFLKGLAVLASTSTMRAQTAVNLVINILVIKDDDFEFESEYRGVLEVAKDDEVFPITKNDLTMADMVFKHLDRIYDYYEKGLMYDFIEQILVPWCEEGEDVVALKLAFDPTL